MKTVYLFFLLITAGCGAPPWLKTNTSEIPNFVWSPFPGVVIEDSEYDNLYSITVKCAAYLDFNDFTISKLEDTCAADDFVGEAYFLISQDQLKELAIFKKRYWDYYLRGR